MHIAIEKTGLRAVLVVSSTAILSLAALSEGRALPAAARGVALEGIARSAKEETMEGVVVSAKRAGSTMTISVVSDEAGRFAFPAERLAPGHYAITLRAPGYDLAAPVHAVVAAGKIAHADLALVTTKNLAAQLMNAEWLASIPGTNEEKSRLLSCNECHTLQRVLMSDHGTDEFIGVMQRMAGYSFNSSPETPQILRHARIPGPESFRSTAKWLSSINLSGRSTWAYPLKTFPRVTGKGTRVIITEYDLPRAVVTQPHDVIVDAQGYAWYTDFGHPVIGRLDTRTGAVKEFPIPVVDPDQPVGSLDIENGKNGEIWVGMMYQGAIGRFDTRTGKWRVYKLPPELRTPGVRVSHVAPAHAAVDGKVWTASSAGAMRFDTGLGQFEAVAPFAGSPPVSHVFLAATGLPAPVKAGITWSQFYNSKDQAGRPREKPAAPLAGVPGMYGLATDAKNNLYALNFIGENIVKIDAKTGHIAEYATSTFASRPRRGHMDAQDRLWFAEYGGNRIGMLDTKTGAMKEWVMPTRFTNPYDAVGDRNGYAWTAGEDTDRVVRLHVKSGDMVEYPLPHSTNVRRVFVDDSTARSTFWIGNNHAASIIKVEPLN